MVPPRRDRMFRSARQVQSMEGRRTAPGSMIDPPPEDDHQDNDLDKDLLLPFCHAVKCKALQSIMNE